MTMHTSELSYNVEPLGRHWTISFCHTPHGSFDRRVDALRAAVRDADRVRRMGHRVTVVVARPRGADLAERVVQLAP
ncbi:hypothetical protein [Aurantimonas endophytica]|uniref:Uncharacterized protein n=1 Tax=Aurantimonas endophytica TaxID=1522175 RepID=A0A7W6HB75_9HYPH|nr:hypothetical protein [Aurantimonas endophytica]MBB4001976.1 hypothetical protein [Aurantimonas endophytica]MCO6402391.1 hypothetical protein [Aurantimonas endophytica]